MMSEPLEFEFDETHDRFVVNRYADGLIGWIAESAGVRCFKSYLSQIVSPSELRQIADFIDKEDPE